MMGVLRLAALKGVALLGSAALAASAPHVHHWTETVLDRLPH